MKTLSFLLAGATLLLASHSPAQTKYYYSPDNNAASGSTNAIPFGTGSTTWADQRGQFLVRSTYLPSSPGLVKSLGFAPGYGGTFLYEAMVINLGFNTTGSLGANFRNNFKGQPLTVLNRFDFSWPVTANQWNRIPLERPFIYNGQDNLVVEIFATGSDRNNKGVSFRTGSEPRAYLYNNTPTAAIRTFGQGCKGSSGKVPAMEIRSYPLIGATLFEVGLQQAPASAPALLFLGNSNTAFAGLPLPFDLVGIGAPGCPLNASILAQVGGAAGAGGELVLNLPIPDSSALESAVFYGQWAMVDGAANPAGLTTTAGLEVTTGSVTPATGRTSSNAGLKIEVGIL